MISAPAGDVGRRVADGLAAAAEVLREFVPGQVRVEAKEGDDPVTAADRAVDRVLKKILPGPSEGWLSEETVDDFARLNNRRVWIVDPLDGTREFASGIPEWCVSIGYVEDGQPVAGGILNPQTGETFIGVVGRGLTYGGKPVRSLARQDLNGGVVLASRSEVRRGEWGRFEGRGFEVRPVGSVAYKLARVAAGLADATWTLQPKNEWDIAAGVALILAAGCVAYTPSGERPSFNNRDTLVGGLIAHPPSLTSAVKSLLAQCAL